MSVDAMPEMPTFPEAIEQFREFLTKEGHPKRILWICREDIAWHDFKFYIKKPLPAANERLVEKLYEQGRERGFGVSLDVFCLLDSYPCCYIWLPEDEQEAELAMVAGLKMSVPVNPALAKPVKNWLLWQRHRRLGERAGGERWLERLPQRCD